MLGQEVMQEFAICDFSHVSLATDRDSGEETSAIDYFLSTMPSMALGLWMLDSWAADCGLPPPSPVQHCAERLDCAQLAGAFEPRWTVDFSLQPLPLPTPSVVSLLATRQAFETSCLKLRCVPFLRFVRWLT